MRNDFKIRDWAYFMTLGLVGITLLSGCQSASSQKMAPVQDKPVTVGQQLFESNCVGCHMANGRGNKMMSPNMPDFTDAQWQQKTADTAIVQTIQAGKGGMPPFDNQFKPAELKALVAYIRHFKGGTP